MAEDIKADTKKALRRIRKGIGGIAASSPIIAAGEAIASVGEKAIEHSPEWLQRAGRHLRRGANRLLSKSSQQRRVRQHQRTRRRSGSRR